MNIQDLVNHYVELSATTDDHRRHDLVGQLFTESAVHYAAPANVSFTGIEAIEANIARVNTENLGAGLQIRQGDFLPNHNAVQLQWEVMTPGGKTIGTRRDFLLLNDAGRITALYVFNG